MYAGLLYKQNFCNTLTDIMQTKPLGCLHDTRYM